MHHNLIIHSFPLLGPIDTNGNSLGTPPPLAPNTVENIEGFFFFLLLSFFVSRPTKWWMIFLDFLKYRRFFVLVSGCAISGRILTNVLNCTSYNVSYKLMHFSSDSIETQWKQSVCQFFLLSTFLLRKQLGCVSVHPIQIMLLVTNQQSLN